MEKTFREMAEELVGQMTVDELATQLKYDSPAIPRLGIPAYNCGMRYYMELQEQVRQLFSRRRLLWQRCLMTSF